jgi:hypothetical protein
MQTYFEKTGEDKAEKLTVKTNLTGTPKMGLTVTI